MGAAVTLVAPRRRAALADGSARGGWPGALVARARGVVMLILSPREPFAAAAATMRGLSLPGREASGTLSRSNGPPARQPLIRFQRRAVALRLRLRLSLCPAIFVGGEPAAV